MKKWLLNQLSQASTWIGLGIVLSAFLLPREYIVFLGILLMFIKDDAIKSWIVSVAPNLSKVISEFFGEGE
jgi:hypothetical protein